MVARLGRDLILCGRKHAALAGWAAGVVEVMAGAR